MKRDVAWMARAACAGMDPRLFFPTTTGNGARSEAQKAIQVCRTCPVLQDCGGLRDELGGVGVWAGRLYGVNAKPRVYVPKVLAPHGTDAAMKRHNRAGEPPCGLCIERRTTA